MRNYFVFMLLLNFVLCSVQGFSQTGDTLFNQKDKQGRKQGFWKVTYENGAIKYTAFFKDDKPIGLMKRYFDDNTIKALMVFDTTGIKARSKLYYQAGPLAAEGNYVHSLKDSTWNYYSFYTKTLSGREIYVNGKKNGLFISYYSDGKIAEELEWKNDVRDGKWRQYYDSGIVKISATFVNGKRTGAFVLNYPNNKPEWQGLYKDNKREGKWVHYDPLGKILTSIEYKDGEATNAAELDAKEDELLKQIEKQKGKIPEPDETNIMGTGRQ